MKGAFEGVATRSPDKLTNVENAVGSLAKGLFDNMFNWLVVTMNQEILPEALKSPTPAQLTQFNLTTQTVGLLDIFGFENFELNQFEQLCINYVNEKLHNLYISSIFGAEKKEMEREGLDVKLKMPDLKVLDVLLLMANGNSKLAPYGLFQLVADKSGSGMGTADMKKRS
jgi:myosin heavy subunit